MTRCPRPGCTGEVVDGNCQVCGIAVAPPADQEAERLRRIAEEQAARLRAAAEKASGTAWFQTPEDLSAPVRPGGAHRMPDSPGAPAAAAPAAGPTGGAPAGDGPGGQAEQGRARRGAAVGGAGRGAAG